MKIHLTTDIPISSGMTVGALQDVLEELPNDADVRVSVTPGDRWSGDSYKLHVSWTKGN